MTHFRQNHTVRAGYVSGCLVSKVFSETRRGRCTLYCNLQRGKEQISIPILFFFRLSHNLTVISQLRVNIPVKGALDTHISVYYERVTGTS